MLVLSRKAGQSIQIGGEISVRVLRIKGRTVQLGIEAPENVKVLRSELHRRMLQGSEQTGTSDSGASPCGTSSLAESSEKAFAVDSASGACQKTDTQVTETVDCWSLGFWGYPRRRAPCQPSAPRGLLPPSMGPASLVAWRRRRSKMPLGLSIG